MSDSAMPSAGSTLARTRPFFWSVRREVWENRAVYLTPLWVAGVVLLGFLISLRNLPQAAKLLAGPKPSPDAPRAVLAAYKGAMFHMMMPQYAVAAILVAGLIWAVFYSLAALHGERRDRSVLFWKSLPVSDRTTVLSKAFVPLVLMPPLILAAMLAAQAVMLALSSLVISSNGLDPAVLWSRLPTPGAMILGPAYGLAMLSLWYAPIVGWLMLVSAWAKRMTFVWALGPPLAICLFEVLAFHTHNAWALLQSRLVGGLAAFTVGGKGGEPIHNLSQIDPMPFLTDIGFWGGLAFAAAALAACVWLRRRGDPI